MLADFWRGNGMKILPYECGVEEEGVEVCRRLRAAGLQAEADWVEAAMEGHEKDRKEQYREWVELLEICDDAQTMMRALERQVESLQKELKALRGG
jgi:uncharacterized protein YlxW (UPF0749 family)